MNFEQKMFRGTEKKYIVYFWLLISFLKLSAAFSAFYIRLFHMLTVVVPVYKTYNIALKEKFSLEKSKFRDPLESARCERSANFDPNEFLKLTVIAFCR